jgi:hypothetical protein
MQNIQKSPAQQNQLKIQNSQQKSCACNFQIFFSSLFFFKCPIFMFKFVNVEHMILFRGKEFQY